MISTSEFRKGLYIKLDKELYNIVDCQHYKPGKGGAIMRTKLKNLKLGTVVDRTFRSGETVEDIYIDEKKLQYMYSAGDMDMESYEETSLTAKILGDHAGYLKEGMEVSAKTHEGQVLDIALPIFVNLKIAQTEPGIRGDTASGGGGTKSATLETGAIIQVPLFVTTGEMIKVDTRDGKYMGRV